MKDQDLAPWPQAGFDRRAFLKGSSAAAADGQRFPFERLCRLQSIWQFSALVLPGS